MAVYFKFKSVKDFDTVSMDGNFISVGELKEKIVDKMSMRGVGNLKDKSVRKKIANRGDIVVISNPETNEDYLDDSFMVPKYSSVLVQRRPLLPVVVADERKFAVEVPLFKSLQKNSSASSALDEVDEFGFDVYADPKVVSVPIPSPSEENEDKKLRAFLETTANQWQKELQGSPSERYARNGQRGEHGRDLQNTVPHQGYVCHRCGVPGHFIQHCPTNGDPKFDVRKVRPPTGIPKTMLIPDVEGAYFLPTGQAAILKPNEAVFAREVDFLPSVGRKKVDIPPELCCPLCKNVFKDAVLVSKCCFMSYCDKCIRDHIISKGKCVCGATVLADDLLPNRTLRDAIKTLMESQGASSTSSGNVSTITSSGNAGPQASAADVPNFKSFDNKKSVAGGFRQGQKPQLSISLKRSTSQDVETGDTSESQLRQSVDTGEIVNTNRPPNGNAGPQASAVVVPKFKSPDNKKPVAGGFRQGQKPQLSISLKRSSSQDVETGDTSESQLRQSVDTGEIVNTNRPPNWDGKRKVFFNSHPTSELRDKRLRAGPIISMGRC